MAGVRYMKITARTRDEFEIQFKELLSSINSEEERIVYFWRVEKAIPRVIGKSDILYIGQSQYSFSRRYGARDVIKIECEYFDRFYKSVIEEYGAIRIETTLVSDPQKSEYEQLEKYFQEHKEYPPVNRVIPRNKW